MGEPAILRRGSIGGDVARLQGLLGIAVDGDFGPKTEAAVEAFQASRGLYADGIVGAETWIALERSSSADDGGGLEPWRRVQVSKVDGKGYGYLTLRESTAARLELVSSELRAVGAILTSSGGRRGLGAGVSANRSATSLHYTGRALDLYLYSGMVDAEVDPFVVTLDNEGRRLWRVWARASEGVEMDLHAWTYTGRDEVSGSFVDLTAIMRRHGFDRIPARGSFFRSHAAGARNDGAAEWWHFQDITGLELDRSTFGDELRKVWPMSKLRGTGPWSRRAYTWTGYGFAR